MKRVSEPGNYSSSSTVTFKKNSKQLQIDKVIYNAHSLKEEDIEEVENWHFRRYPKLANAIENKLKEKD